LYRTTHPVAFVWLDTEVHVSAYVIASSDIVDMVLAKQFVPPGT